MQLYRIQPVLLRFEMFNNTAETVNGETKTNRTIKTRYCSRRIEIACCAFNASDKGFPRELCL
jgi:hypothetical protein